MDKNSSNNNENIYANKTGNVARHCHKCKCINLCSSSHLNFSIPYIILHYSENCFLSLNVSFIYLLF